MIRDDKGVVVRGGGGGVQNEKNRRSKTFLRPLSRQGNPPPFKEWQHFVPPPFNMPKTLSYHVKKQTFCAPLQHGQNFIRPPPPLFIGVKLHMYPPPLPFCNPPSPSP